jgi:hypothetical protein
VRRLLHILDPVEHRFRKICRICGKWTVFAALAGVWNAAIGTYKGVEAWREQVRLQEEYKGFPDDLLAHLAGHRKWENLIEAGFYALIAVYFIARARRRWIYNKRATSNLCISCGYDLRATPERCPECGTIPPNRGIISN